MPHYTYYPKAQYFHFGSCGRTKKNITDVGELKEVQQHV